MMKPTLPLVPRMTQSIRASLPAYMLPKYTSSASAGASTSNAYSFNGSSTSYPSAYPSSSNVASSSRTAYNLPQSHPAHVWPNAHLKPTNHSTASHPKSPIEYSASSPSDPRVSPVPAPTIQWCDFLSMV